MKLPRIFQFSLSEALRTKQRDAKMEHFAFHPFQTKILPLVIEVDLSSLASWDALIELKPALIILSSSQSRLHDCRQFFNCHDEQNY